MPRFRNDNSRADNKKPSSSVFFPRSADAKTNRIREDSNDGEVSIPSPSLSPSQSSTAQHSIGNKSSSTDNSHKGTNPTSVSLGIEDDYFSSDLSFDYGVDDNDDNDENDEDYNPPPTEIIWSESGTRSSPKQKTPTSILKDSPLLSPTGSIGNVKYQREEQTPPASSKKKTKVSFGSDVEFRQKTNTPPKPSRAKRSTGSSKTKIVTKATHATHSKGKKRTLKSASSRRKVSSSVNSAPNVSTVRSHKTTSISSANNNSLSPAIDTDNGNVSTAVTPSTLNAQSPPDITGSAPSWIPRRGLGIDTRILQSFTGDAVGNTFHNHITSFLQSCADQGVLPTMLGTTAWKEPKTKSRKSNANRVNQQPGVEANATNLSELYHQLKDHTSNHNVWDRVLPSVTIRPPSNMNNTKNRDAIHVPKRLLASDSWRTFGDMVDAIILESSLTSTVRIQSPLEITIISNDVALFTDMNTDSHKRAMARLWDRMREKFDANQIRSIKIIVFQTGADALQPSSTWSGVDGDQILDANGTSTCDQMDVKNASLSIDQSADIPHRFKVAHCAKVVQNHLTSLLEKEFKRNSGQHHGRGTPMEVCFEGKDFHPVHFQGIIRDWSREIISSATGTGCISFDLPETLDGTQCSVMLNLSYSILPYPVNSAAAGGLVQNLKSWTNSYFEVLQLVPLDDVDLSFIYGVPITAKAGLDGDLEQYREMQKLVTELWKYLASRDVAIVLSCVKDINVSSGEKTFFDSDGQQQIFLLMAQIPSNGMRDGESPVASGNGMLYQYLSNGNQILEKENDSEYNGVAGDDYTDLIKSSLEFLDNAAINPCVLQHGSA